MTELPILCICFNRLDTSQVLFERLKQLGIRQIHLSIDGPRDKKDRYIQKQIMDFAKSFFDVVHLNCLKKNNGVSLGPVKALDWFFSQNDFGVILEDDIIPTKEFFDFVKEIYCKYNGVDKVLTINSGSYSTAPEILDLKYYYSGYVHIWGWATWSNVWSKYRLVLSSKDIDKLCNQRNWNSSGEKRYWRKNFYKHHTYHWDFQLSFLSFELEGINITPTRTLTENIGFEHSSHLFLADPVRERKAFEGELPQSPPQELIINSSMDYQTYRETRSFHWTRVIRLLRANGFLKIAKFLWKKSKS